MKKILLTSVVLALFSLPAHAAQEEKGLLGKMIEKVGDVLTGGDEKENNASQGAQGRENAAQQIENNIEKHGGSHKGLENAQNRVRKNHHEGSSSSTDDLIEEVVEDLVDEVTDSGEASEHSGYGKSKRHNGNGGSGQSEHHKGKGRDK